jgi:hypothetical protein
LKPSLKPKPGNTRPTSLTRTFTLIIFSHFAIFSTTSVSFHGHPAPLACPPDRNRKSIATYYYSNSRPKEDPGLTHNHEVAFQQRPGINRVKGSLGVRKIIKSLIRPFSLTSIAGFANKQRG